MYAVSSSRTMAGAQTITPERKPTPKRDRLIAAAHKWNRQLAAQQAREARRQQLAAAMNRMPPLPKPPTRPREIIEQVAAWHGVSTAAIVGRSMRDIVVAARFDAVAAIKLNCRRVNGKPLSLSEIGRFFGGRDHTTIFNALRRRGLA